MADDKFEEGMNVGVFMEEAAKAREAGQAPRPMKLTDLLSGNSWDSHRQELQRDFVTTVRDKSGKEHTLAVDMDPDGNVFAVAAGVPRAPGRAEDFLRQVSDFTEAVTNRKDSIALYRRIYEAEGIVNNAVNKAAGLVASKGSFRVRYVKGIRGKGTDKRAEEFRMLLQWWVDNVNASAEKEIVKGARGIQAFIAQGVRQCLIEGDHVSRTTWDTVNVPVLNKAYSVPVTIQSFRSDEIEIPDLAGQTEIIFWVPPAAVLDALRGQGQDAKIIKKELDKVIPREVQNVLKRDGKYQLESLLLTHIKHRGTQTSQYGESFIRAAMSDLAYKRALQALDIVTIENLINRLMIIKIGSDDPNSVYHKQEVTQRRVLAMQNMLRRIGPSSTIVWAGPDVELLDTGANGKVWEIDNRMNLVNSMIRQDLGISAALLTGEGADGKAAGWASVVGVAAQLGELQNHYAQALKTWAERMAVENGFEDVDVTWEFHQNLLANKTENVAAMHQAYQDGVTSTRTYVEDGLGMNYEAEESRQLEDVAKGYKEKPFGAPLALQKVPPNPTGEGGEDGGRPADTGKPDPRDNKETQTTEENK